MAQLSAFDVLGPNMIGPSSSHTAGAAVITYLAQKMINGPIIKATFTLYGSFAHTYSGHGTDRALLGGLLGFHTDDKRIRDSFRIASERGIEYHFIPNDTVTDIHPNSVDILMENEAGTTMLIRGESLGGGKVRISRINNVEVELIRALLPAFKRLGDWQRHIESKRTVGQRNRHAGVGAVCRFFIIAKIRTANIANRTANRYAVGLIRLTPG